MSEWIPVITVVAELIAAFVVLCVLSREKRVAATVVWHLIKAVWSMINGNNPVLSVVSAICVGFDSSRWCTLSWVLSFVSNVFLFIGKSIWASLPF